MREHPTLFSDDMVQAILAGRKTETRRPVKPWHLDHLKVWKSLCDYRNPGDRLWVREAHCVVYDRTWYRADKEPFLMDCPTLRWTPSIHMPRHRCRLLLEVTDCSISRLLDISLLGAKREGCPPDYFPETIDWFRWTWDRCYGAGNSEQNPLVWVYKFKVVENAAML